MDKEVMIEVARHVHRAAGSLGKAVEVTVRAGGNAEPVMDALRGVLDVQRLVADAMKEEKA